MGKRSYPLSIKTFSKKTKVIWVSSESYLLPLDETESENMGGTVIIEEPKITRLVRKGSKVIIIILVGIFLDNRESNARNDQI